jgi:hypothetical protein
VFDTARPTLLLVALAACRSQPPSTTAQPDAAPPMRAPLDPTQLPTTDGAIAVGNFEAQIADLEARTARGTADAAQLAALVDALTTRGQFLGRLADYDRALSIAEELMRARPADAASFLARAGARATLHLFDGAAADLARAETLGAPRGRTDALHATLDEALGRDDEALAARVRLARTRPALDTLALEAGLRAERGELDAAERLFVRAQQVYRDVSPFAVAWLYFQNGLVEERAGRPATARTFYAAARARLPLYAAATAHLAGLETRANAIALLRPLVERSDDPEYWGQLSTLLGGTEEGDRLRQIAAARFEALCRARPEAFAAHAARFWLGPGGDVARALALAERDFAARPTRDAALLLVEAATAAGDAARACAAADRAIGRGRPTPALRLAAARAYAGCGKLPQSEALLTLAPDAGAR